MAETQATIEVDAQKAADLIGVSTWTLAHYLKRAAADRCEAIARRIAASDRDDPYYYDEEFEDVVNLLRASDACRAAYALAVDGPRT